MALATNTGKNYYGDIVTEKGERQIEIEFQLNQKAPTTTTTSTSTATSFSAFDDDARICKKASDTVWYGFPNETTASRQCKDEDIYTQAKEKALKTYLEAARKKVHDILQVINQTKTGLTADLTINDTQTSPTTIYTFSAPTTTISLADSGTTPIIPDLLVDVCIVIEKEEKSSIPASAISVRNEGENGRPVLGVLHINPSLIPVDASDLEIEGYINVIVHQLYHILGFSVSEFGLWEGQYYRLANGTEELVPIQKDDTPSPPQPPSSTDLPSLMDDASPQVPTEPVILSKSVYLNHTFHILRSQHTVDAFIQYYGENPSLPSYETYSNGTMKEIKIPNGPELQTIYSGKDLVQASSHLTQRVYFNELMSESLQQPSYITNVSLCCLFDTGWYTSVPPPEPAPAPPDPPKPVDPAKPEKPEDTPVEKPKLGDASNPPVDPVPLANSTFQVENPSFGMITLVNGTVKLPPKSPQGFAVNAPVIAFQSKGLDSRFYWHPTNTYGLGRNLQTYTKLYATSEKFTNTSNPSTHPEEINKLADAKFGDTRQMTLFEKELKNDIFQYVYVTTTTLPEDRFDTTVFRGESEFDGAFFPKYLGSCLTKEPPVLDNQVIDYQTIGENSFPVLSVLSSYITFQSRDNPSAVCVPFVIDDKMQNLYMVLNATKDNITKTDYYNCSTFGDNAFVVPNPNSLRTYVRCPHNIGSVISRLSKLATDYNMTHANSTDPNITNPFIGNSLLIENSTTTWDGQFEFPTIVSPVEPGPQTVLEWIQYYFENYTAVSIVVVCVIGIAIIVSIWGCCFCCFCKQKDEEKILDGKQRLRAMGTSSEGSLDEETTSSDSGSGVARRGYRV